MSISEISLYKSLRSKLGDEAASELVEFVKNEAESELQSRTDTFLTKSDKIELIEKMGNIKLELLEKMNNDKSELLEKMGNNRSELLERMNKGKMDLLKWQFGFWITLVLLFIAHWYLQ